MATTNWTNSAQQVFEDCDLDSFKEKDPYSMKGWSMSNFSMNEKNIPRNVLGKVSDLMPTSDQDGGHAPINRKSWKNNVAAIEREYERTGSIGRHDLVCLLSFVDEANYIIEKLKNPTEFDMQDKVTDANRIEDLERGNQHLESVIADMTKQSKKLNKILDKAAGFAAYALCLEEDPSTRLVISDWLIDNGYKKLVPGTNAYADRLYLHKLDVAELQEARDRAQVSESMNAGSVAASEMADSIKSEASKIINQIKEEEDQEPPF